MVVPTDTVAKDVGIELSEDLNIAMLKVLQVLKDVVEHRGAGGVDIGMT